MTRIVLIVILIIGVLLLFGGCSGYQHIVTLDEGAKSQWAQVENQLQRRFDLIPNIVETVKGYAAHEKEIFEAVANARQSYFQAKSPNDKTEAATRTESALSRLLALREAYPQLKANEGFLKLQDQLEGTENRLSVERERYNEAVRQLDTYLRSPTGALANLIAHVEPRKYFEVPEAAKAVPKVDFSSPPAAKPAGL